MSYRDMRGPTKQREVGSERFCAHVAQARSYFCAVDGLMVPPVSPSP